jgi:replicative DNA helicase
MNNPLNILAQVPADIEAENAIIGACLMDKEAIQKVCDVLNPDDFYDRKNQEAYNAMLSLEDKACPIDIITVNNSLKRKKIDIVGHLTDCMGTSLGVSGLKQYAKIVKEKRVLRELLATSNELIENVKSGDGDADDMLDMVEQRILSISKKNGKKSYYSVGELTDNAVEKFNMLVNGKIEAGIPTGFKTVDEIISGIHKSDLIIIGARTSVGKALTNNTLVAVSDGWKKMGELTLEDMVIGSDGRPHKILGIFPQGRREVYRVGFDDGTFVDCDKNHIWTTQDRKERKYHKPESNKTTNEIVKSGIFVGSGGNIKSDGVRKNHSIRFVEPIQYSKKEIKIDPYTLGVYLGDGSAKGNVMISNPEEDIVRKLVLNGDTIKKVTDNDWRINGGNLKKEIVELGLDVNSYYKFIPKEYLYNSVDRRIELLKGLLDTDGSVVINNRDGYHTSNRLEYSTTSSRLRDDIIELVRGLGGRACYTERMGKYKKDGVYTETRINYRVWITINDFIPVNSEKHLSRYTSNRNFFTKFINKIEKTGKREEMTCIMIDSPDHLYLVQGHNLTHNSSLAMSLANNVASQGHAVAFFSLEMSKEQLTDRLYSMRTGIGLKELTTGKFRTKELKDEAIAKVAEQTEMMDNLPLEIDDTANQTVFEIKRKCRRIKAERKNLSLVVIDYLQLLKSKKDYGNTNEQVSDISRSLKALAKELDVTVVALSQLSRNIEQRDDPTPKLSDLRDSGAIEADADIVIVITASSAKYSENYEHDYKHKELHILKHRNGPIGLAKIEFDQQTVSFK